MKKIKNITQLNVEIARLKVKVKDQEKVLRSDLIEIKESLKPVNLLVSGLSSVTGVNITSNEFLKDGLAYGLALLFQRFIIKSESKIEHKLSVFVETVIEKIKKIMEKFNSSGEKKSERMEDNIPSS